MSIGQRIAAGWDVAADMDPSACAKCGKVLEVGEWPFCGGTNNHGFPNVGVSVVDDTVIGGRWCETLGHEPYFYTSKTQLRREAERRGLVNVVRHDDAYYAGQRRMHDERKRDERHAV